MSTNSWKLLIEDRTMAEEWPFNKKITKISSISFLLLWYSQLFLALTRAIIEWDYKPWIPTCPRAHNFTDFKLCHMQNMLRNIRFMIMCQKLQCKPFKLWTQLYKPCDTVQPTHQLLWYLFICLVGYHYHLQKLLHFSFFLCSDFCHQKSNILTNTLDSALF